MCNKQWEPIGARATQGCANGTLDHPSASNIVILRQTLSNPSGCVPFIHNACSPRFTSGLISFGGPNVKNAGDQMLEATLGDEVFATLPNRQTNKNASCGGLRTYIA
jgi:hypothetical protein